jgi:hypothetical protein
VGRKGVRGPILWIAYRQPFAVAGGQTAEFIATPKTLSHEGGQIVVCIESQVRLKGFKGLILFDSLSRAVCLGRWPNR